MAFVLRNSLTRPLDYVELDENYQEMERLHGEALEARDVSLAQSIIYPTTTDGLAATAEGGYFVVPDTSTDELVFYREEAGVAVEKVRIGARLSDPTLARTNVANIFTRAQRVTVSNEGADATTALRLFSDSTTPASGDYLATLDFMGRRSDAVEWPYVVLRPQIFDPTPATLASKLDFIMLVAGAQVGVMAIANGVIAGNPTGGFRGTGSLNAEALYVSNSPVLKNADIFVSTDQTITLAGALTLAHGLGVAPRITGVRLVCQTAELGYSAVNVVQVEGDVASCVTDATNLNIRYRSVVTQICHKTTGVLTNITAANWKAQFFALK